MKTRIQLDIVARIGIRLAVALLLVSVLTPHIDAVLATGTVSQGAPVVHLYLPIISRSLYSAGQPGSSQEVWRPFNDDSPWNTPLGSSPPIDPSSDAFIATINDRYRQLVGYGEAPVGCTISAWSVPIYYVENSNPYPPELYVPAYTSWGRALSAPIPYGAQPDPSGDSHLSIIDRQTGELWDFWSFQGTYPQFSSGTGVGYDLYGSGVRPPGEPGCRESGFPLIAGLIRPEEIEAGEIHHALAFAFDARDGSDQFVYPASTGADYNNSAALTVLPLGARLQLKPHVDISAFPRTARIVAQAMKDYGMYLGEENDSTSLGIYFQTNGSWEGLFGWDDRSALRSLTASDFRVIQLPPIGGATR